MRNVIGLAPRLAIARLRTGKGVGALDALAVIAFTISTWMALTVAGGTWMFYQRSQTPPEGLVKTVKLVAATQINAGRADEMLNTFTTIYLSLAAFACVLLVVPIFSLGAAAARLGARGRSERLSAMRLVGMTGSETIALSLTETFFQVFTGIIFGSIAYAVSLPAWHAVSFQNSPISPAEMLLPWWLWVAVVCAVVLIAMTSAIVGLRQVRISPLGVARRTTPPALKWWPLVILGLMLIIFFAFQGEFTRSAFRDISMIVVPVAIIGGILLSINLAAPYLLALLAKPLVVGGSAARMLGVRRILDDPKRMWRSVSAISLLVFIGTGTTVLNVYTTDDAQQWMLSLDINTGVIITMAIGFLVAAVNTVMSQSADIIDRAPESRSLHAIGMRASVMRATRRYQALIPLVLAVGFAFAVAYLLGSAVQTEEIVPEAWWRLLGLMAGGSALMLGAVELATPLENMVLRTEKRRND